MAVDDDNFDIMDLQDLNLGDLAVLPSFHEFPESQLCVPTDPIEDLEWFPSFSYDFISLNESSVCFESAKPSHCQPPNHDHGEKTKQQRKGEMRKDWVGISEAELCGFAKKKGRTKKNAKRGLVGINRKRCSHCETEETPQWRVGPLGPKTLCNACGVRFKSGRLVPEYRPAASPTFDGSRHSNYHRKILKRRGIVC